MVCFLFYSGLILYSSTKFYSFNHVIPGSSLLNSLLNIYNLCYLCEMIPSFPFLGIYCYNWGNFRIFILLQAPEQMVSLALLKVSWECVWTKLCYPREVREWWVRSFYRPDYTGCYALAILLGRINTEKHPNRGLMVSTLSTCPATGCSAPGLCIKDWAWTMTLPKTLK